MIRPTRSVFTIVASITPNDGYRWKCNLAHEGYRAAFPGDGTNSVYSLQYYSELQRGTDAVWLYPVFIPGAKRMAHFDD